MRILCSNQTGTLFGYLCGRFPEYVGNLFSVDGKFTPFPFAPYALDNGAFPAWKNGKEWDESIWLRLMDRAANCPQRPLWAIVPDVVADKERTIERWHKYLPVVRGYGFAPAFAVQDGMRAGDVPADAAVIFVGGSTDWKWQTVEMWCGSFPRVHVGRVNSIYQLERCYECGAESTDGTGWFRGSDNQLNGLIRFLDSISSAGNEKDSLGATLRAANPASYFRWRDAASNRGETQGRLF